MKGAFLFAGILLQTLIANAQYNGYSTQDWEDQRRVEAAFLANQNERSFKNHLKQLTLSPHVVGSPANEKVRDYIATVMANAGLEVRQYPYDVYLPKQPGTSSIEIVTPSRTLLNQKEDILPEDPSSQDELLWKGWNAFSGTGDVTAEVVYANYGRKEDFEKLAELGVDLTGKVVIARYGGNFRGFKAKFAEASGASALIIYTDPKDSGFTKGLVYPDGPYYTPSTIQRGSLLTTDFTGDPLTPFEPALPLEGKTKIKRLRPEEAQFHTIPVTPIGYGEAEKILGQMKGQPVPHTWQGGLPFTYRIEGGKELTVRVNVVQKKGFVRATNVVGMLKGSEAPEEWIILGSHYDAWGFGATDPNSGTAMLLSLSETLGALSKSGFQPKRSILIAHWDAEEHGVIGSSEWVEQFRDELALKGVAYMNYDGGVSGKNFGASSAPTLKKLLLEGAKKVNYPYSDQNLYDFWNKNNSQSPPIGNLGGGSDHIAFYMHVGVPSLSGGAGGPNLYHSNYDSFPFYEKYVDPEFKMGPMVEHLAGLMALTLANGTFVPYDVMRYAADLKLHFENATAKVLAIHPDFNGFSKVSEALPVLTEIGDALTVKMNTVLKNASLTKKKINRINALLIDLEKSFIYNEGMSFGSWYKSLYAASDPFSGYGAWILPALEYEIAIQQTEKLDHWDTIYAAAIESLSKKMEVLILELDSD